MAIQLLELGSKGEQEWHPFHTTTKETKLYLSL
jgi:hypothetical protein